MAPLSGAEAVAGAGAGSHRLAIAHARGPSGRRTARPASGGASLRARSRRKGVRRASLRDLRCGTRQDHLHGGHRERSAGVVRPCARRQPCRPSGRPTRTPDSMSEAIPVTLIPGDGIGPEIVSATVKIVEAAGARIDWDRQLAGMAALNAVGDPMPVATLESIARTGIALKGPLETQLGSGYRSVNVALRMRFDLFANVRPARTLIPNGRYTGVDIILVRENTEGLYSGVEHYVKIGNDDHAAAESVAIITRAGAERVIRFAFEHAVSRGRRKLTLVHKANILKLSQGLFLETGRRISKEYEGRIVFEERIIDAMAMHLVLTPERYDVIVTTNMFGDILSDEISGLVGGLGLAPGANIGEKAAIFEAVHGTAPDIAGKGFANPSAQMLAAAMMLDHIGELDRGQRIRQAVADVIVRDKVRTRDLGGSASTEEFGRAVARRVA